MNLAEASHRFEDVLRSGPGVKLTGQITNLKDGTSNYDAPVRVLLVAENSPARPSMEVITPGGFRYLLADNGNDYSQGVVKRSYMMIPLDRQDDHSRRGKVIDPVTKLEKDEAELFSNPIWYHARGLSLNEGVLRIPEARYSIITGADIREGDKVGHLRILFVETRLGVQFAEAR